MNTTQRIHITLGLLAVLTSVILFSFGAIGASEILWWSVLFIAFGELAFLVDRLYRHIERRSGIIEHHVANEERRDGKESL